MTNATHEGQRLYYEINCIGEQAFYEVNKLRKNMASTFWRAYDTDPEFDYTVAIKEAYDKILSIVLDMKKRDESAVDRYLDLK